MNRFTIVNPQELSLKPKTDFRVTLGIFGICAVGSSLLADEPQQHSLWYYHPLHVGGQFVSIGSADCHHDRPDRRHHLGNVKFSKANAFVTMMTPIDQHHIFFPQVQYNYVTFDWNKNLKFKEKHFSYLQFDVMFYWTALERWRWIFRFDYNIQTDHISHPGLYSLYNGLFWGQYQLNPNWHYHIGALGYAGMEGYDILPIIGLDYSPSKRWLIQAVFPINYSVEYKVSEWTFSLKGRPLKERLRTGKFEPQPRSIFCYSSLGSELNIHYERQFKFSAEIYGGYNWGGSFYVKNIYGKHAEYVDVKSSLYGGASIDYGF